MTDMERDVYREQAHWLIDRAFNPEHGLPVVGVAVAKLIGLLKEYLDKVSEDDDA